MSKFRTLVERQIAKTRASGGLSGLKGEGKPLPDRPVETSDQAAMSAGMRIMAEAGVLPEEFAIRRALDDARAEYAQAQTTEEKNAAMAKLSDLELRHNIAQEARRKFMS